MAGTTNRAKYLFLQWIFNGVALPTNFYLALVRSTPDADTNTLGQLTEIPAGNGYTSGGTALSKNTTDFPSITEDDTNDLASVTVKDTTWTAAGGPIPASGGGATYVVLTTDEGTVANRQVIAFASLGSNAVVVVDGQPLTISLFKLKGTET